MIENCQLIALPIPDYLVDYMCGKLRVSCSVLKNGARVTTLPIRKNSFFGEFIHDNLRVSRSFDHQQSNFYIKISDRANQLDKNRPDTRNNIVRLPPSKYLVIAKLLRDSLQGELLAHVEGSIFTLYKLKGTKKGIAHQSIYEFMEKNAIPFSSSTFETLKKIYNRAKKNPKPLKTLGF